MSSLANIVKRKKTKKQTWITAEILDLCDKRRELRKKRFEPEGSEKYKEVKNNSKRAYELVKDLATVKQGKVTTVQDRSGKCLTEERQILNRWTEYCSELYNHKANGDPSIPRTVPRQTQRMTTPSFAEKWRLQYNH